MLAWAPASLAFADLDTLLLLLPPFAPGVWAALSTLK